MFVALVTPAPPPLETKPRVLVLCSPSFPQGQDGLPVQGCWNKVSSSEPHFSGGGGHPPQPVSHGSRSIRSACLPMKQCNMGRKRCSFKGGCPVNAQAQYTLGRHFKI